MRAIFGWLTAIAVVLGAGPAAATPVTVGEPKPLPPVAFETMDGAPADLEEFRGKVVVLNLWATWCAPCREEMPSLDELQAQFDPQEMVVLALSMDRAGPERVQAFLDEIGVTRLSVYRDPKAAATRTLKAPGLPTTLLIDREGREVGRIMGIADWAGPEAVAAVRSLLAGESLPGTQRAEGGGG
ncbi:TlpA family protein disulfide reductase [Marinimicrococcus flavescens]|uniref:TlpA disulfide reductase family protein n=1 Tax=Marinimicrococcus flavescens TaxID=3031815 RepID=A0AAP3XSY6_9PROT|nr:TlpA disulfide reductase family protein [Marinimicrococcus flavescens]